MPQPTRIDQRGATPHRDLVGGNVTNNNTVNNVYNASPTPSVVGQLLQRLEAEMQDNTHVHDVMDSLRLFYEKKSHDGVDGLEAKLNRANRKHESQRAIEKKELFVKLLDKWSLYASAQEIFVYLLARAEQEFAMHVLPQLGDLKEHEINGIIDSKIVEPIVTECGATIFQVNHGTAMGLFYWLAEQCFVRWHQ
jgi:hypothetical protein